MQNAYDNEIRRFLYIVTVKHNDTMIVGGVANRFIIDPGQALVEPDFGQETGDAKAIAAWEQELRDRAGVQAAEFVAVLIAEPFASVDVRDQIQEIYESRVEAYLASIPKDVLAILASNPQATRSSPTRTKGCNNILYCLDGSLPDESVVVIFPEQWQPLEVHTAHQEPRKISFTLENTGSLDAYYDVFDKASGSLLDVVKVPRSGDFWGPNPDKQGTAQVSIVVPAERLPGTYFDVVVFRNQNDATQVIERVVEVVIHEKSWVAPEAWAQLNPPNREYYSLWGAPDVHWSKRFAFIEAQIVSAEIFLRDALSGIPESQAWESTHDVGECGFLKPQCWLRMVAGIEYVQVHIEPMLTHTRDRHVTVSEYNNCVRTLKNLSSKEDPPREPTPEEVDEVCGTFPPLLVPGRAQCLFAMNNVGAHPESYEVLIGGTRGLGSFDSFKLLEEDGQSVAPLEVVNGQGRVMLCGVVPQLAEPEGSEVDVWVRNVDTGWESRSYNYMAADDASYDPDPLLHAQGTSSADTTFVSGRDYGFCAASYQICQEGVDVTLRPAADAHGDYAVIPGRHQCLFSLIGHMEAGGGLAGPYQVYVDGEPLLRNRPTSSLVSSGIPDKPAHRTYVEDTDTNEACGFVPLIEEGKNKVDVWLVNTETDRVFQKYSFPVKPQPDCPVQETRTTLPVENVFLEATGWRTEKTECGSGYQWVPPAPEQAPGVQVAYANPAGLLPPVINAIRSGSAATTGAAAGGSLSVFVSLLQQAADSGDYSQVHEFLFDYQLTLFKMLANAPAREYWTQVGYIPAWVVRVYPERTLRAQSIVDQKGNPIGSFEHGVVYGFEQPHPGYPMVSEDLRFFVGSDNDLLPVWKSKQALTIRDDHYHSIDWAALHDVLGEIGQEQQLPAWISDEYPPAFWQVMYTELSAQGLLWQPNDEFSHFGDGIVYGDLFFRKQKDLVSLFQYRFDGVWSPWQGTDWYLYGPQESVDQFNHRFGKSGVVDSNWLPKSTQSDLGHVVHTTLQDSGVLKNLSASHREAYLAEMMNFLIGPFFADTQECGGESRLVTLEWRGKEGRVVLKPFKSDTPAHRVETILGKKYYASEGTREAIDDLRSKLEKWKQTDPCFFQGPQLRAPTGQNLTGITWTGPAGAISVKPVLFADELPNERLITVGGIKFYAHSGSQDAVDEFRNHLMSKGLDKLAYYQPIAGAKFEHIKTAGFEGSKYATLAQYIYAAWMKFSWFSNLDEKHQKAYVRMAVMTVVGDGKPEPVHGGVVGSLVQYAGQQYFRVPAGRVDVQKVSDGVPARPFLDIVTVNGIEHYVLKGTPEAIEELRNADKLFLETKVGRVYLEEITNDHSYSPEKTVWIQDKQYGMTSEREEAISEVHEAARQRFWTPYGPVFYEPKGQEPVSADLLLIYRDGSEVKEYVIKEGNPESIAWLRKRLEANGGGGSNNGGGEGSGVDDRYQTLSWTGHGDGMFAWLRLSSLRPKNEPWSPDRVVTYRTYQFDMLALNAPANELKRLLAQTGLDKQAWQNTRLVDSRIGTIEPYADMLANWGTKNATNAGEIHIDNHVSLAQSPNAALERHVMANEPIVEIQTLTSDKRFVSGPLSEIAKYIKGLKTGSYWIHLVTNLIPDAETTASDRFGVPLPPKFLEILPAGQSHFQVVQNGAGGAGFSETYVVDRNGNYDPLQTGRVDLTDAIGQAPTNEVLKQIRESVHENPHFVEYMWKQAARHNGPVVLLSVRIAGEKFPFFTVVPVQVLEASNPATYEVESIEVWMATAAGFSDAGLGFGQQSIDQGKQVVTTIVDALPPEDVGVDWSLPVLSGSEVLFFDSHGNTDLVAVRDLENALAEHQALRGIELDLSGGDLKQYATAVTEYMINGSIAHIDQILKSDFLTKEGRAQFLDFKQQHFNLLRKDRIAGYSVRDAIDKYVEDVETFLAHARLGNARPDEIREIEEFLTIVKYHREAYNQIFIDMNQRVGQVLRSTGDRNHPIALLHKAEATTQLKKMADEMMESLHQLQVLISIEGMAELTEPEASLPEKVTISKLSRFASFFSKPFHVLPIAALSAWMGATGIFVEDWSVFKDVVITPQAGELNDALLVTGSWIGVSAATWALLSKMVKKYDTPIKRYQKWFSDQMKTSYHRIDGKITALKASIPPPLDKLIPGRMTPGTKSRPSKTNDDRFSFGEQDMPKGVDYGTLPANEQSAFTAFGSIRSQQDLQNQPQYRQHLFQQTAIAGWTHDTLVKDFATRRISLINQMTNAGVDVAAAGMTAKELVNTLAAHGDKGVQIMEDWLTDQGVSASTKDIALTYDVIRKWKNKYYNLELERELRYQTWASSLLDTMLSEHAETQGSQSVNLRMDAGIVSKLLSEAKLGVNSSASVDPVSKIEEIFDRYAKDSQVLDSAKRSPDIEGYLLLLKQLARYRQQIASDRYSPFETDLYQFLVDELGEKKVADVLAAPQPLPLHTLADNPGKTVHSMITTLWNQKGAHSESAHAKFLQDIKKYETFVEVDENGKIRKISRSERIASKNLKGQLAGISMFPRSWENRVFSLNGVPFHVMRRPISIEATALVIEFAKEMSRYWHERGVAKLATDYSELALTYQTYLRLLYPEGSPTIAEQLTESSDELVSHTMLALEAMSSQIPQQGAYTPGHFAHRNPVGVLGHSEK